MLGLRLSPVSCGQVIQAGLRSEGLNIVDRLTEWRNGHGSLKRGGGYTKPARYEDTGMEPEEILEALHKTDRRFVNEMTGNEYQTAALRTVNPDIVRKGKLPMDGVLGLCGEAGEVADIIKKAEFQGHDLDKSRIAEELGDIAWYLAIAAEAIGSDLDSILQQNIDKLMARYPAGFDSERSIHRPEYEKEGE